jgi:hypothetical protein
MYKPLSSLPGIDSKKEREERKEEVTEFYNSIDSFYLPATERLIKKFSVLDRR